MRQNSLSSLQPLLITILIVSCLLIIPLRVIGYGFSPRDDALRHAAKIISGKNWNEILIMRKEIVMDTHPGWHAILGFVHTLTACDQDGLVAFSVVFLFFLFSLVPLCFLRQPEAWLATLLALSVFSGNFVRRLFLGRPYIATMAAVIAIYFLWPRLKNARTSYKTIGIISLLIALSTWIHGSWYLFALPAASFFLARQWRAGIRFCVAMALGILLGATFTGHPYLFLKQNIMQFTLVFGSRTPQRVLAYELQPFNGDTPTVILLGILLLWRGLRGAWDKNRLDSPVFLFAVLGWTLGFIANRPWYEWGMVALCVWLAEEFQEILRNNFSYRAQWRWVTTLFLTIAVYLSLTNDVYYRWTENLNHEYLSLENPLQAKLLPEPGGILYSDDMTIFYSTFFKNPHASWRYILGFEPEWMPPEDLAIFRGIQNSSWKDEAYVPWARKMTPRDRLILKRMPGPPAIPGLIWYQASKDLWIGKLPEKPSIP